MEKKSLRIFYNSNPYFQRKEYFYTTTPPRDFGESYIGSSRWRKNKIAQKRRNKFLK